MTCRPQTLNLLPQHCTLKTEYDSKTSPCSSHYEQVKGAWSSSIATTARENNGKSDCAEDYPGVFIDFVREDGATVVLACVEYDPDKDLLQTVVYGDCASDEPTAIVEHYNTDFEE